MTRIIPLSPEVGMVSNSYFLKKIAELEIPITTNNKGIHYYNIPAAFDIEVSSFMQNDEKKALMYIQNQSTSVLCCLRNSIIN